MTSVSGHSIFGSPLRGVAFNVVVRVEASLLTAETQQLRLRCTLVVHIECQHGKRNLQGLFSLASDVASASGLEDMLAPDHSENCQHGAPSIYLVELVPMGANNFRR